MSGRRITLSRGGNNVIRKRGDNVIRKGLFQSQTDLALNKHSEITPLSLTLTRSGCPGTARGVVVEGVEDKSLKPSDTTQV